MNKSKLVDLNDPHSGQFLYLGRWVEKKMFRAFVYDKDGKEKLADSYEEFEELTSNGLWFASKPVPKERKQKDAICTAS